MGNNTKRANAVEIASAKKEKVREIIQSEVDVQTSLKIEIVTYQQGEIIRTLKGTPYIQTISRENNELRFAIEIETVKGLQWSKQIGKIIDLLLASEKLKIATKKIYSNKLNLNFEIHFNNKGFEGKQFLQVRPNFFTSPTNLNKFFMGLTLFFGSLTGEFKQFSYELIDFKDAINGKNKLTEKTYEKAQAHKIGHKPLKFANLQLN